ncbi:DUF4112 domain-containing protein [Pleurocapsa sp. CCALA 161]|uniref:DUF4112 domain-containing protein n=1 Tax=Pleurocapsa sp. CCALA 161 TaxID=2107688 RepID=UPI000D0528C3|nr:DUF4112 domain-containing protein [Pleurocapsa sp. CCALA 161]PSB10202.1 DUF4112 domain-containing protein [Pleurocapsa sp. CCALA 161]
MKTPLPAKQISKLTKLRRVSRILDNAIAIPGTKISFGLDPILGLLPGGGDTVTGGIAAYIVVEAARMGVPREILWKMVGNILIDSFAGTVPVVGDIFDLGWKANIKNIELLEKHLDLAESNQSDRLFIFGLIILLTLIILGFATIAFFTITWFWGLIIN